MIRFLLNLQLKDSVLRGSDFCASAIADIGKGLFDSKIKLDDLNNG